MKLAPRSGRGAMLVSLAFLAACARPSPSSPAREPQAEGRTLYLRACASCHGSDGRGGGPVVPALCVPPPDLTTLAVRHDGRYPRADVIDMITGQHEIPAHGAREMPVWSERFGAGGEVASFYARRRDEVLADYVESLQRE